MTYPLPVSKLVPDYIKVFLNTDEYFRKTGKKHEYDSKRPVQLWEDTRSSPDSLAEERGYFYNIIARDARGYFRLEVIGVPWKEARVCNIPPVVPVGIEYQIPIRDLIKNIPETGGEELVASSPFGCEIIDSTEFENIGLLTLPPEILYRLNPQHI